MMKSDSKRGHLGWDVWLRSGKQSLAAFTVLLMLALGLIIRREDYEFQHLHVENESAWTMNEMTSYRRIHVDSGATVTGVNTGTIGLLRVGSRMQPLATQSGEENVITDPAERS